MPLLTSLTSCLRTLAEDVGTRALLSEALLTPRLIPVLSLCMLSGNDGKAGKGVASEASSSLMSCCSHVLTTMAFTMLMC